MQDQIFVGLEMKRAMPMKPLGHPFSEIVCMQECQIFNVLQQVKKTERIGFLQKLMFPFVQDGIITLSKTIKVKSLSKLVDIYYNSVGLNSSLLLNLPVDTRGLVHENEVAQSKCTSRLSKVPFSKDYSKLQEVKNQF